jgi:hypothetical protein
MIRDALLQQPPTAPAPDYAMTCRQCGGRFVEMADFLFHRCPGQAASRPVRRLRKGGRYVANTRRLPPKCQPERTAMQGPASSGGASVASGPKSDAAGTAQGRGFSRQ